MSLSIFSHLITHLLDSFFPVECVLCRAPRTFLCRECRADWRSFSASNRCTLCEHAPVSISRGETLCASCRRQTGLDALFLALEHETRGLREAIHALKYEFLAGIADILSVALIDAMQRQGKIHALYEKIFFVPVPIDRQRQFARGFNQSELLARLPSTIFQYPILSRTLDRRKSPRPQVGLSREERLTNLEGVIACQDSLDPSALYILVDDICTTGTTLRECAHAMKQKGAKHIAALVLSKGV